MNTRGASYRLHKLRRRYLLLRLTENLCWSAAAGVTAWAVMQFVGTPPASTIVSVILVFALVFTVLFFSFRLTTITSSAVVRWIDLNYPELQNSTGLLLADPDSLNGLQRLQFERTAKTLEVVAPAIRLPHFLKTASALLLLAVILLSITLNSGMSSEKPEVKTTRSSGSAVQKNPPAGIKSFEVAIEPPAYTGLEPKRQHDPSLNIHEGSRINWDITFNQQIKEVFLVLGRRDTTRLKRDGDGFRITRSLSSSTLYQIAWRTITDTIHVSDYYPIDVIKDRPPEISIQTPEQFTEFAIDDNLRLRVVSSIRDDYGLSDSYLIATVAKGSGESVKFREERLRFDKPQKITGKTLNVSRDLDLRNLGLEAGDELYFYVVAQDNRIPRKNQARTETFFVSIQDTSQVDFSIDTGLGVDLMPEYFRSQRQIIIDSEKLLNERKTISKKEFNSRSNDLAHDQKVLRLRYGQFLGEEFESGMIEEDHEHDHENESHEDGEENEDDVAKKFGHDHDGDNEHNLVPEHSHADEGDDDEEEVGPLKGFVHQHDDMEEATFFTESIRTKLKAALGIMWEAELHLRMSDPRRSLPWQYKALTLLKEISNDSRIYVHRTGFDAPPIKEDKRLTGELDEVKGSMDRYQVKTTDESLVLENAAAMLEVKLHALKSDFSESETKLLRAVGEKVAAAAVERPGSYLDVLNILRRIVHESGKDVDKDDLQNIRKAIHSLIPKQPERLTPEGASLQKVDSVFIKNIFE